MQQSELSSLCRLLAFAKHKELAAKRERTDLEDAIDRLLPAPTGTEGTTTKAVDGFKITINRKMTRKLDHEAYLALNLPPENTFVKYEPKIDLPLLRRVESSYPEFVSACVTTKPAKVAIKVEEIV